jgi:flagellar basal-body rod modification protein FlgD
MTVGQLVGANNLASINNPTAKKPMGRDEFLQLLVAQLKNQNPMDPVNGADFAVQLAQFSQLENLMQLNDTMRQIVQLQQLAQAASLVGRRVQYQSLNDNSLRTGVISSVQLTNNGLVLQVDGHTISPMQIRAFLA